MATPPIFTSTRTRRELSARRARRGLVLHVPQLLLLLAALLALAAFAAGHAGL